MLYRETDVNLILNFEMWCILNFRMYTKIEFKSFLALCNSYNIANYPLTKSQFDISQIQEIAFQFFLRKSECQFL